MGDTSKTNPFIGRHGPLLIAEIGGNHEGDFDYALKLADLAIDSGADVVKFQLYRGDTLVSPAESPDRNKHFKKFELSREQHLELARRCETAGVIYMASVWDLEMLEWIDPHMPIYKIGSGDLTAYPVLREFARRGKPMIISTGLATLEDVVASVQFIQGVNPAYKAPERLAILQCTAMYPIENKDANLRVMDTLRSATGLTIGYSDHTEGSLALLVAAARGAQVLEFHFTDVREGKAFRDHKVSLTRDEVRALAAQLDEVGLLLGSAEKRPLACEVETGHVTSFRRAVYCRKPLRAGDQLAAEDLVVLRPNHGVDARQFDQVVGQKVKQDLAAFERIELESVQSSGIRCNLCASENMTLMEAVNQRPSGEVDYRIPKDRYGRVVYRCEDCGLYTNAHDLIDENFYSSFYNEASYAGRFGERFKKVRGLAFDSSDNKHRAARLFDELTKRGKSRHARVLDVGMGLCVFLAEMRDYGFECHGLDPDQASVDHALSEAGVASAYCGTLEGYPISSGPFDLITFNKVLEHVTDPVRQLKMAKGLLSADGVVYVELPDGDLALSVGSITGRAEFNIEHLSIYNEPSLRKLAALAGFTVARFHSLIEPSGKATLFAILEPVNGVA